ncbi:DUF6427 family protein [Aquimarina sp. AD10]|nr:DUF6427 family protein [Aquimarina sp. AD10]
MSLLYTLAHYVRGFDSEIYSIILFSIGILFYVLPMIMLNFITQTGGLTEKGTYTIVLYAFFTSMLPNGLTNIHMLVSSAFILLGLRSLLELRNGKFIKANLFNASLCIGIASVAHFWSIGFILLLFLAIFYFEPKNYRNWMIPGLGLCTVFVFANCYTLLVYDSFFSIWDYIAPFSLSFQSYIGKSQLFSVGILTICIVFFLGIYIIKFSRRKTNVKPILKLIIAYLVIAIAVMMISEQKNTSELFFITVPLAIMGSTYLEMEYHWLAKEINIWVFALLPFTILLF